MTSRTGPLSAALRLASRRPLTTTLVILGAASSVLTSDPVFSALTALLTVVAAVLLIRAATNGWSEEPTVSTFLSPLVAGGIVTFGVNRLEEAPSSAIHTWAVLAVAVGYVALRQTRFHMGFVWLLVAVGTVAAWMAFAPFVIDVWHLHTEAADNIAAGTSPHSGLAVDNGSPTAAPDDLIEGYPYPLIALIPFALARWSGVDPRVGSAIVWLAAGLMVAFVLGGTVKGRSPAIVFLLATAWVMNLWSGFTESVTIALFVASSVAWTNPVVGGVFAGLAIGSKQYMVVLAPLLLTPLFLRSRRRLISVVMAVLVAVGAGAIWDPKGFWDNAVVFHLTQPPRPDAINPIGVLTSLGWTPPLIGAIAVVAGLVVAFKLRSAVTSLADWLRSAAAVLAVTFVLTPQTFPNYWFLVLSLVLLSIMTEDGISSGEGSR